MWAAFPSARLPSDTYASMYVYACNERLNVADWNCLIRRWYAFFRFCFCYKARTHFSKILVRRIITTRTLTRTLTRTHTHIIDTHTCICILCKCKRPHLPNQNFTTTLGKWQVDEAASFLLFRMFSNHNTFLSVFLLLFNYRAYLPSGIFHFPHPHLPVLPKWSENVEFIC